MEVSDISLKTLTVIPARGGSKGIPKKNLVDLEGKPLVAYAIEKAVLVSKEWPMDVLLSTDDISIKEVAESYGAWCPFLRPAELAKDNVESLPVVKHAAQAAEKERGYQYDLIVYLNPCGTLWRTADLVSCLDMLVNNKGICYESAIAVTSVSTHPFRMKRLLQDGRLINYIDQGFEDMRPRQSLPPVYRRAGSIYASWRSVIFDKETLIGDPCYGLLVPPETAVDIDSIVDLELVRSLLKKDDQK